MHRQFLLWTDEKFVGFASSANEAQGIARKQQPGAAVYACDFDAPPDTQFLTVPGPGGGKVTGRLGWTTCLRGLRLADAALSDDVAATRDVMKNSLEAIPHLQTIATRSSREWEAWRNAKEAFEAAKELHAAFCNRYAALAGPYITGFAPFS